MKRDCRECPYCGAKDSIVYIRPYSPWHDEFLICENCDSTYSINLEHKGDVRSPDDEGSNLK